MDNKLLIKGIIDEINHSKVCKMRIMEVCGTHTHAISKSGIRSLLPCNITLLSGPGCPVCVTDESHIDAAIQLLNKHNVILATFGDMMRVGGTHGSLWDQLVKRKDIKVVYSPLDCLELAKNNSERQVVFFAVGFETTAPSIALTIKLAYENKLHNLTFLTSLKLMPPVLRSILEENQKRIDGIICPGHVAAVMGAGYFRFISLEYGVSAAVCGFEALDIAAGLHFLFKQYSTGASADFVNLYKTCVTEEGNKTALKILEKIFIISDSSWRGIGEIKESSLVLNDKYSCFDALKKFNLELESNHSNKQCNCKDVLLGNILPFECKLYGKECTPQKPAGPCMVSTEGSCSAYYRYRERGV
jgi:hydrogenase expression/formation protein HypD